MVLINNITTNYKLTKDCSTILLREKKQNLNSSTPQTSNPIESQNTQTHLLIGSLNTRGLNDPTKLLCLIQHITDTKYIIFGLSETKLTQEKTPKQKFHPYHTIWNPTKENTKAGTALFIHKTLFPHLYKTEKLESYIISCYFQFKPQIKICITQIYIPHDKHEKQKTLSYLTNLINKNKSKNIEHIIMGDFNATPKPLMDREITTNNKPELKIYKKLNTYSDTYRTIYPHKQKYTYVGPSNKSRIDQIWISQKITPYLTHALITPTDNEFPSDHQIISITILNFLFINQIKQKKIFISNEQNTPEETWNIIKTLIKDIKINQNISIDQQWNKINNKLTKIKKQYIPRKKIIVKTLPPLNETSSNILKKIKTISKTIIQINNQPTYNPPSQILNDLKEAGLQHHNKLSLTNALKQLKRLKQKHLSLEIKINNQEKIKQAIDRRISLLSTKPKQLISNILEHKLPRASFTKIIDPNNSTILFSPEDIKNKLTDHFTNIFRPRQINKNLQDKWKQEYLPKPSINSSWYDSLLHKITEKEIELTILDLPSNKAPGPNGITYNFVKQTHKEIIPILVQIFNQILETGNTPSKWSNSNIYPISKKLNWSYNILETRPIALLDTFRKIFTKILTKRLGHILSSHPILSKLNYAGLPNQSTFEPINILNSIYNIHKLQNKELWILSLDISAAFDSVNLNMLQSSMKRIQIPEKFIKISSSLLTNRKTQILNEHGPTKTLNIMDGIDQGDSISPIWWIIFYDPLISKLESQITNPNITNALAYMDDLNLLSTSKTKLQTSLNITTEFFLLNDIKANPSKTKLLAINTKETKEIQMMDTPIKAQHSTTPIRILGIWISEKSIIQPNRTKIIEDVHLIKQSLKRKYTTGPIAIYLYKKVLLPRIEYKLQTTYLTSNQLKKTQQIIDTTIKHKFELERTIPNNWFYNPQIFNYKPISNLQEEVLTSNLQYKLTNPSTKPFLNAEIRAIQNTYLFPLCPINHPPSFKINNLIIFSSNLLKKFNLTICHSNICTHTIQHTTPLYNHIPIKYLKTCAKKLSPQNIFSIEQIQIFLSNQITRWDHFSSRTGNINRGRTPFWYKTINNINFPTIGNTPLKNNSKRKWISSLNTNNSIIIGKKQKTEQTNIIANHWHPNYTDPNSSIHLTKCTGCHLNQNITENTCQYRISKNKKIINLFHKKTPTKIILRTSLNEIQNKLNHEPPILTPILHLPHTFETFLIESLPNSHIKQTSLNLTNKLYNDIEIYITIQTDKTNKTLKKFFISTPNNSILLTSKSNLPFQLLNLQIILFLIISSPNKINLNILTPHYKTFTKNIFHKTSNNFRHNCKFPYFSQIKYIQNIITQKNISLNFFKPTTKIKKQTQTNTNFNFSLINISHSPYTILNNNSIPQTPIRTLIKKINIIHNTINILNSNRTQNLIKTNTQYLPNLLSNLKNKTIISSTTESSILNFHLKIITNSLPTKKYLLKKLPHIYHNSICPRCHNAEETISHIWSCPTTNQATTLIIDKFKKTISEKTLRIKNQNFSTLTNILNFSLGYYDPKKIFSNSMNKPNIQIIKLLKYQTLSDIRQLIWLPRNKDLSIEDQINDITKKMKMKRPPQKNKKTNPTPQTNIQNNNHSTYTYNSTQIAIQHQSNINLNNNNWLNY